ncbi:hypothetical protein SAMN05660772_02076 [Pasteurella testudinis DSM 23072]|uniref:Uncharacterized protein n=1 Tax=Pasteurella testudinis DSM 23072 TaxID=1122938 RepID=A0A1W1UMP6_9PAST|nr:hypothetical protein SAMN05660772_02076 [Pasteurella testudinis DSM 23072]SUB52238.1 Uncharacterised protein [Pasteurella testudinis]
MFQHELKIVIVLLLLNVIIRSPDLIEMLVRLFKQFG